MPIDRQTDRQTDIPYSSFYKKVCGLGEYAKSNQGGQTVNTESYEDLANFILQTEKPRTDTMMPIVGTQRLMQVMGVYPNKEGSKSRFSCEKYKFFLDAPFDISNKCCNVMKKNPCHKYEKQTGRKPIIGTMAAESKLRTQKWLQNRCNGFEMKKPTSTPISFWTNDDVLLYLKERNIPICSVYGDIVEDGEDVIEGQMHLSDFLDKELFDLDNPSLKTTGCSRTGCVFCLFGIHLEKEPNRLQLLSQTHPKLYEYLMKPESEGGLGYKDKIDWINEHGNMNIKY